MTILILLVNFWFYRPSFIEAFKSFSGKNLVGEVKLGKLWGNFEKLRTESVEFSGWSQTDAIDLSLEPQTGGVAIYQFARPAAAAKVILQLSLTHPGPGSNQVSVSVDGYHWQTVVQNNRFQHLWSRDISQFIGEAERFWVKIEASNGMIAGPAEVILYDFYLMFYRREIKFPPLVLMLVTIFFPVMLIIRPRKLKALKLTFLFLVILLGIHLSLKNLYQYRYRAFDSDVLCLIQEVPRFLSLDWRSALLGNYCDNKESLNPLIIIGFWQLFGFGSEMGIRLSSLAFHWLTIVFIFWYGRKIRSFTAGLAAALFLGTHPYLIQLSARGLRDPAFTFIITVFVFLLWETDLKRWRNLAALLLAAVFSIYLRLHSLVQLSALALVRRSFLTVWLLGLIAAPLIATNLKIYGTWNYSEQMHLIWNANVEFAGKVGWPSKEAVTIAPFAGPPISVYTYFFKLHTWPDLFLSTLGGVVKTFSDLYFKNNPLTFSFFVAGIWAIRHERRYWYLGLMVFLLELPHFFLASKNLVEYRSMTQSLPFIGLIIGYIIDRLWNKLSGKG